LTAPERLLYWHL